MVKKELIKKGCYVCGWQGTEEVIELALIKKEDTHSYWTDCPKCGRRVVREELGGKGCFICGYKPEMADKRDG